MRGVIGLIALSAGCGFSSKLSIDAAATTTDGAEVDAPVTIDGPPANTDWWDPSWHFRRRITVTNAHTAERLTNFPVLVPLPHSFDYTNLRADGHDLRFVRDDGTLIPYDLDTLDPIDAPGSSIWVSVTIDPPPNAQPQFWMYYGFPGAPNGENAPSVFGVTNVSVHHLTDLKDATGNGHAATPMGTNYSPTTASAVGLAMIFDGTLGLTLPQEADFDFTTTMSASLWMWLDVDMTKDWEALLTKGDGTWRLHHDGGAPNSPVAFSTSQDTNAANNDDLASGSLALQVWHHIGFTLAGGTKTLVIDGGTPVTSTFANPIQTTNAAVAIGDNLEMTGRHFVGKLDEVRITNTLRSTAWLANEYQTVKDPQFVTLGSPESQ